MCLCVCLPVLCACVYVSQVQPAMPPPPPPPPTRFLPSPPPLCRYICCHPVLCPNQPGECPQGLPARLPGQAFPLHPLLCQGRRAVGNRANQRIFPDFCHCSRLHPDWSVTSGNGMVLSQMFLSLPCPHPSPLSPPPSLFLSNRRAEHHCPDHLQLLPHGLHPYQLLVFCLLLHQQSW